MRNERGTHGEAPIARFWYGKGARFKSIEELIDNDPSYFIWTVERFQDVTVEQAQHFYERYGMELPDTVIAPAGFEPFVWTKGYKEEDYIAFCDEYWKNYPEKA